MNEKLKQLFIEMGRSLDLDEKLTKIIMDDCENEENIDKWIDFFRGDETIKCGFHIYQQEDKM